MYPAVFTKDPAAVQAEVLRLGQEMFPQLAPSFVNAAFGWTRDCFEGRHPDYQPIDARYHDLEHTMQGTLCFVRLLHGRGRAGAEPRLSQRMFEVGLCAILLHDTGYLKRRGDNTGTGAKYTVIHVRRSAEFARALLPGKGFTPSEIQAVENMIHCTGLDSHPDSIPFQSEEERIAGHALATADLLGQMAAPDYVAKLPVLFSEFQEASQFSKDPGHFVSSFQTADDLKRKTVDFWDGIVKHKLEADFRGLVRFLNPTSGPSDYINRIEENIARLRAS
jgi:hypothetical protein